MNNIRKIIREQLEALIVEGDLKSKTKKGNRYLDSLKTAQFQHYDMPKGELSSYTHGEEDRKRLVSKLNKEDKKNYKEWLKTDEGKMSLEVWEGNDTTTQSDIVSESNTMIDKYGDVLQKDGSWPGLNFPIKEYKTNVKDRLVNIITNDRGISEKSFSQYDEVIKEVANMFKDNDKLNSILIDSEAKDQRPEYVAEKIYNEFIR